MSEHDLLIRQLTGLACWQQAPEVEVEVSPGYGTAKEMRLEAQRRVVARERQREMLQARAAHQHATAPPTRNGYLRAIVVHPHDYQRGKLVRAFAADGRCAVIAEANDGAAAVGLAVVEQPDVILLGQQMPYMTGFEAIPQIRRYSPSTTVAICVAGAEHVERARAAGAHIAFTVGTPFPRLVADLLGAAAGT